MLIIPRTSDGLSLRVALLADLVEPEPDQASRAGLALRRIGAGDLLDGDKRLVGHLLLSAICVRRFSSRKPVFAARRNAPGRGNSKAHYSSAATARRRGAPAAFGHLHAAPGRDRALGNRICCLSASKVARTML